MKIPTKTTVSTRPDEADRPEDHDRPHGQGRAARKYPSSAQLRFWNGSRRTIRDSRLACSARSSGIRICTQPTSAPGLAQASRLTKSTAPTARAAAA